MQKNKSPQYKIGLALGSGSSRGWAHIGVIRALEDLGIHIDIVCGCSIGAIVGAAYVSNKLEKLSQWACACTKRDIVRFFEFDLSFGGFIDNQQMHAFLNEYVCNEHENIEAYKKQFACVSTDLQSGREIWFTHGETIQAIKASISLPGLFPPVMHNGRWLVDGGLVNPVPVSVCRSLGSDIVIAVNLNGDIVGKHFIQTKSNESEKSLISGFGNGVLDNLARNIKSYSNSLFANNGGNTDPQPPNIMDAIAGSINITQDRITRSRMAGDPPDLLLSPKLSHIGLLEFYRAKEAVEEGRQCVTRMSSELQRIIPGLV